jgi:hypothetical protein
MSTRPATTAILVGGGIAGALDITYAIAWAIFRGKDAQYLLQVVASGWLGEAAFQGGWPTAASTTGTRATGRSTTTPRRRDPSPGRSTGSCTCT